MLFTSILFLTVFLPLFLLLTFAVRADRRNAVALIFSVFFYFWGAPHFVPVVLLLGAFNYRLSQRVAGSRARVALGVTVHVLVLVYYKYLGFFARQFIDAGAWFGWPAPFAVPAIVLPLGISFITFEQISYLVDVYRGDARPARTVFDYWLFLLLFPHSIAGPIFRWRDLDAQIRTRALDDERTWRGFARFAYGLAKKALLANAVAHIADAAFALPAAELGLAVAWLGAVTYALQIYLDFSAYSDMAIGLGGMVGFTFKENFALPYHATSVTDFWQRWHISLTSWFRLYLYIPLGGNRGGRARTLLNVLAVFVVSGFWHGAAWTFVAWGLYHGLLIVLERLTARRVGVAPTLALILVGWVFFRANSLAHAIEFLVALSGARGNPPILSTPWAHLVPWRALIAAGLGGALVIFEPRAYAFLRDARPARAAAWTGAAAVFAMAALVNSSYNPFIYFRF